MEKVKVTVNCSYRQPKVSHVPDGLPLNSYLTDNGVIDIYRCSRCGSKFNRTAW